MSVHRTLPQPDDLSDLAQQRDHAITIYVPTSPVVAQREASQIATKSAFDRAFDSVKAGGAPHAVLAALDDEWDRIADDEPLWGHLSAGLACFLAPGFSEVFVLPTAVQSRLQVADYFDIGQLLRAMTLRRDVYAVLLSANEWSLWTAGATNRAAPIDVSAEHPRNLAESMSRDPLLQHERKAQRLGDPDLTQELELYVKRVSDAVAHELTERDPDGGTVIFVFAAEPLVSAFTGRGVQGHRLVPVHGAPDRLGPADIDAAVRDGLADWAIRDAQRRVDAIADESGAGLATSELADIALGAVAGAVDTLVFAYPDGVNGRFDESTGRIEPAAAGEPTMRDGRPAYDVLSRIAVTVMQRGGTVIAVRPDEVSSPLWNGVALAGLRYTLA